MVHYQNRLKPVLEDLAKAEHRRWNAFHYVNGWTRKEKIAHGDQPRDNKNKQHVCLVDWDELDRLSIIFHQDYKENDRSTLKKYL
jgi:hypothetical protein